MNHKFDFLIQSYDQLKGLSSKQHNYSSNNTEQGTQTRDSTSHASSHKHPYISGHVINVQEIEDHE